MQRGIGRLRAGGSGGFSPASVFAGGGAGLWLAPDDISTGYQDSAGTTPQTASGQPTGKRLDKSGRGNHVTQATGSARPEYDVIGGISSDFLDGVDDGYATAIFAAGTLTADMDYFVAIKRSSAAKGILSTIPATTAFFGCFESGSAVAAASNVGTPTHFVNGVAVPGGAATTRLQLDAALPNGTWVVLEIRNLDLSAWGNFQHSLFPGYPVAADIGQIILCPAQSAANRSNLRRYCGAKVGLSLS